MSQKQHFDTIKCEDDLRAYFVRQQQKVQVVYPFVLMTESEAIRKAYDKMINAVPAKEMLNVKIKK